MTTSDVSSNPPGSALMNGSSRADGGTPTGARHRRAAGTVTGRAPGSWLVVGGSSVGSTAGSVDGRAWDVSVGDKVSDLSGLRVDDDVDGGVLVDLVAKGAAIA